MAGVALLIGGLAAPRVVSGMPATFGPATARLGGTLAVAGALMLLRRGADVRLSASRLSSTKSHAEAWWWAAVSGFVVLDSLLFGWSLVPTVDRSLYHGETDVAALLSGEPGPVRVYWPTDPATPNSKYSAEYRVKFSYLTFDDFGPHDVDYWWKMREALLPNTGMLDGVASANNFDPLLVGRHVDLLEAAVEAPGLLRVMGVTHVANSEWRIANGEPQIVEFYRLPDALGRAWVVPVARQVSPDEMLAALTDPAFDPTAEVLLEHPVSSSQYPISNVQYQVTLQDAPNRVTIHAVLDTPGYLVLADTWYPGWQATVDGEPAEVLQANYAFRAVYLAAGEHTVEMDYQPTSVLVGEAVSLTTLTLLVVGLPLTRRREARA